MHHYQAKALERVLRATSGSRQRRRVQGLYEVPSVGDVRGKGIPEFYIRLLDSNGLPYFITSREGHSA